MSTTPPPVDSAPLVLSNDPRLASTDWQTVTLNSGWNGIIRWARDGRLITVQIESLSGPVISGQNVASLPVAPSVNLDWTVNTSGSVHSTAPQVLRINASGTVYLGNSQAGNVASLSTSVTFRKP